MKCKAYLELTDESGEYVIQCGHRGTGGEQGRIYSVNGIACCIPASCYKDPMKILEYERKKKVERR